MSDNRQGSGDNLRTLFCIGVRDTFFAANAEERKLVFDASREAFADLHGRFGVRVLGTMDDDETKVGPSTGFPWTCYILADVPDHATVTKVCAILRDHQVRDHLLWNYFTIEARVGRELFFGNE